MLPVLPTSQLHNHNRLVDSKGSSQTSTSRQPPSPTQSVNKRPSSMIFRIEHLLPTAATTPSTGTTHHLSQEPISSHHQRSRSPSPKRTKVIRGGVHCSQLIPKDTISECIDTQSLIGSHVVASESVARAYCSLAHEGGHLNITPSIMRKIKLSEDLQSYNALFELKKEQVTLRVTRDVQRDDEIVAWFGEEVTLLMSIPFLTPLNIQGNNRYTCHLCHLTFETPNPLKIHLALGCGRHNIDVLWIRLHYAIKATQYRQQLLPLPLVAGSTSTTLRVSPMPATSSRTSTSLSPTHSPQPTQGTQPTSQRFSAFKPISPSMPVHHQHAPTSLSLPVSLTQALHMSSHHHTSTAPLSFLPSMSTAALPHMSLLQPQSTNPLNAAAQIEAIVSNMGASKQGHLCIYCGKVYSRKYGLKIHIRTHTGFKPLKCKFCLRPFGDPSNLNKHVRLHLQSSAGGSSSSAEGYQCTMCHKTLARRRDLQKHMETRHGCSTTLNVLETDANSSD